METLDSGFLIQSWTSVKPLPLLRRNTEFNCITDGGNWRIRFDGSLKSGRTSCNDAILIEVAQTLNRRMRKGNGSCKQHHDVQAFIAVNWASLMGHLSQKLVSPDLPVWQEVAVGDRRAHTGEIDVIGFTGIRGKELLAIEIGTGHKDHQLKGYYDMIQADLCGVSLGLATVMYDVQNPSDLLFRIINT